MKEQPSVSTFLVVYTPGPAWLKGEPVSRQPLKEHGRFLLDLYVKGILKLAGPFADDTGGAVMITAHNAQAADTLVAADPAVVSQVFDYELHPWALVSWEAHLTALRPTDAP